MILGFESASGDSLNLELGLESLSVRRELGVGVRIVASAFAPAEGLGGGDLGELAQKAEFGRIVGVPRDPAGRSFGCPKGTVTGLEFLAPDPRSRPTGGQRNRILISMDGGVRTGQRHRVDCSPRWRVLRGATLQALAAKFERAARLDRSVEALLSQLPVNRPPDADATLIQAGRSDREMLSSLLAGAQWRHTRVPTWWPLVFSGVINEQLDCLWTVQSVSKRAHVNGQTFEERRVRPEAMAGRHTSYLGRRFQVNAPQGEREVASVAHRWDARAFDEDAWKQWRQTALPLFVGGAERAAAVVKITDEFFPTGRDARMGWNTTIETIPEDVALLHCQRCEPAQAWIGEGVVRDRDVRKPWITVELPRFESVEDGNLVRARLVTSYGGSDGNGGVNLVPEVGTTVPLWWSGTIGEPVLVYGNVRSELARLPSPSWHIETPWEMEISGGHTHSIGEVKVDGPLTVHVNGKSVQTASAGIELEGNGGRLELKSGKVRTGRV